jgi:DNA invertase Pin-like site-specific DNA recombinase
MATSDELLRDYMEALAAEGLDRHKLGDIEAELIGKVGRMRLVRDRHIRDMETARLLPHGAPTIAERQHCHRSTVYRRAERGRHVVATNLTGRDKSAV